LRRALRQAARRGVEVKLLLPGPHSDHPWFAEAGRYYYRYLLAHGVQIYEYQPRFQHMKLLVCDDWVSFGSCNQDRWNQRWNLEANVEVQDAQFATELREIFATDFGQAELIAPDYWRARPWWRRLKTYFLYRVSLALELWLARKK
jgi:phosphatidylserine/phosphatidylglycerophosphate/cardiolipin synthase-like enzyme